MIISKRVTRLLAWFGVVATVFALSMTQATNAHAALAHVSGTGGAHNVGVTPHSGQTFYTNYPAAPPVVGDYPGSVVAGANSLNRVVVAIHPNQVGGYSQGAQVVRTWANQHPSQARRVSITTVADPCTEGTGIVRRWDVARWAVATPCHSFPAGTHVTVINRADDPIGNFPQIDNGIAVANALAAYSLDHGRYGHIDLNAPGVTSYRVGNVTYVTLPAHRDPALVRQLDLWGIHLNQTDRQTVRNLVGPAHQAGPRNNVIRHNTAAELPAPSVQSAPVRVQSTPAAAYVPDQAAPVPPPVQVPTSIDDAANQVAAVVPPQAAPVVNDIANAVKQSPVGPMLNQFLGGH